MTKYRVSYTLAGVASRKEITIDLAPDDDSPHGIAKAVIQHEFPKVDDPFRLNRMLTAEQTLRSYAITDVTATPA